MRDAEFMVLKLLSEKETYGYEMFKVLIGTHTFSFGGHSGSTITRALRRFERSGWVTTTKRENRRRYYDITDLGRSVLQTEMRRKIEVLRVHF